MDRLIENVIDTYLNAMYLKAGTTYDWFQEFIEALETKTEFNLHTYIEKYLEMIDFNISRENQFEKFEEGCEAGMKLYAEKSIEIMNTQYGISSNRAREIVVSIIKAYHNKEDE